MKNWFIGAMVVVLGAVAGIVSATFQFHRVGEVDYRLRLDQAGGPVTLFQGKHVPSDTAVPRVEVEGSLLHDFGTMDATGVGSHSFVFWNKGEAPLNIETKSTTCKCTVSQLEKNVVLPGKSANVTLEWRRAGLAVNFHQRAEIATNDPEQPIVQLSIRGRILPTLVASPSEIMLRRVTNSRQHEFSFAVHCYRDVDFRIEDYELLDAKTADSFQVEIGQRLTGEQITEEPFVRSGYVIRLSVLPGLGPGRIRQKLRLRTNLKDIPTLDVPLVGDVVSDISIVGPNFDRDDNVVKIGTVRSDQNVRKELFVLVKGPYRDQVQLIVDAVDPAEILQVHVGDRSELSNGLVHKYPLTIEIQEGSRATSRLGGKAAPMGEFHILTTHPQTKVIPVYVRFAVQG